MPTHEHTTHLQIATQFLPVIATMADPEMSIGFDIVAD